MLDIKTYIKKTAKSAGILIILALFFPLVFPNYSYSFELAPYQSLSPNLFLYSYKENLAPETDTEYGLFAGAGYRAGLNVYLTPAFGVYGSVGGSADIGKLHYNGFIATDDNTMVYYYHTDGMFGEANKIGIFEKDGGFTAKQYFGANVRYWIRSTGEYTDRITGSTGYGLVLQYEYRGYKAGADLEQSFIPRSPLNFVVNRGQRFDMGTGDISDVSLYVGRKNLTLILFYEIFSINKSNYALIDGNPWFEPSSIAKETGISLNYKF